MRVFMFVILMGLYVQAITQRSVVEIPATQFVSDLKEGPDGFFLFGSTNHNVFESRSDLTLMRCDADAITSPVVESFYHSSDNLIAGNMVIGKTSISPTAAITENIAMSGTAFNFEGDAFNEFGILALYNNLTNSLDWSLRTTSGTLGVTKCTKLLNGDFVFMYNFPTVGGVNKLALTRINSLGSIVWEQEYVLGKEEGESINYIQGTEIMALKDGNFIIAGTYSLTFGSPLNAFYSIVDEDGKIKSAFGLDKTNTSSHSVITGLAQSQNTDEIYVLGKESETADNRIYVARLASNGKILSHRVFVFDLYSDPSISYIVPNSIAIQHTTDIVNVIAAGSFMASKGNIHIRYNPLTDNFDHFNAMVPFGVGKGVISPIIGSPKFMTLRIVEEGMLHTNVCVEKLDQFGNSDNCYRGILTPDVSQYNLGRTHKLKLRRSAISNLASYSLSKTSSTHSSDYCGAPAAIIVPDNKTLLNSQATNSIEQFNVNQESLKFMFESNANSNITIFTIQGQLVEKLQIVTGKNTIDISSYPPGVYIMIDESNLINHKFIKQ